MKTKHFRLYVTPSIVPSTISYEFLKNVYYLKRPVYIWIALIQLENTQKNAACKIQAAHFLPHRARTIILISVFSDYSYDHIKGKQKRLWADRSQQIFLFKTSAILYTFP